MHMNTKILLIGLAVIVLGGGVYLWVQPSEVTDKDNTNQQKSEQVPADDKGTGSFASLMDRGENITCTFSSDSDGVVSNGTFYFSEGKYRVESETQTNGLSFVASMIGLEDTSYIWGATPQGEMALIVPSNPDTHQPANEFAKTEDGTAFDLDTGVAYDCKSWRPEPSMFIPPNDIEFKDMGKMFDGMPSMPEGLEVPDDLQML